MMPSVRFDIRSSWVSYGGGVDMVEGFEREGSSEDASIDIASVLVLKEEKEVVEAVVVAVVESMAMADKDGESEDRKGGIGAQVID